MTQLPHRVDTVLVHGDVEPLGPFWEELISKYPDRVSYVYRSQQSSIYGRPITKLSPMSDVLRLDILLKYGGIYTDWDAVWVKELDTSIRQYDTVVSLDWPGHLKPYPDTLNLGVMLAKPGAPFIRRLLDNLHDFEDGVGPNLWCYICLKSYKVYEKYPNLVKIDHHLQVIAYQNYYHPTWIEGYHDIKFEPAPSQFNWSRGDVYALHWTWPTPPELRSVKFTQQSNSIAAQVARYILLRSNIDFRNVDQI